MRKNLLMLFLSIGIYTTMSAQKMTSGSYTATISDLKSREYSGEMFGKAHDFVEYTGKYSIEKDGTEIARQAFSTLEVDKEGFTLNIKQSDVMGNTLIYNLETKRYEFMGEERKPKKSRTTVDLILSGLLIYAEMYLGEE